MEEWGHAKSDLVCLSTQKIKIKAGLQMCDPLVTLQQKVEVETLRWWQLLVFFGELISGW
jgi:hypothetical protein